MTARAHTHAKYQEAVACKNNSRSQMAPRGCTSTCISFVSFVVIVVGLVCIVASSLRGGKVDDATRVSVEVVACSCQWHEIIEGKRIGSSGTGSTILFSAIILKRTAQQRSPCTTTTRSIYEFVEQLPAAIAKLFRCFETWQRRYAL